MLTSKAKFYRRKRRNTHKIKKSAVALKKPIMYVDRTGMHIHVQVIDPVKGHTIAAASTLDKGLKGKLKSTSNLAAATEVGKLIAKKAQDAGVKEVVFNRGGLRYHGRVKALGDAAREAGLKI